MRILDKYLFRELIAPFFFGLSGYIIIMSVDPLINVIQYIFVKNAPTLIVLKWYFFRVFSENMIYSFSMSSLLASFIVFGRLAKDNEITACMAGGIDFKRLLYPVIGFGLVSFILAFIFTNAISPYTTANCDTIEDQQILLLPKNIKLKKNIIKRVSSDEFIYAEKINMEYKRLYNAALIKIKDFEIKSIISSKFADYTKGKWIFYNGREIIFKNREVKEIKKYFQKPMKDLNLKIDDMIEKHDDKTKFNEMGFFEIKNEINKLYKRGSVNIDDYLVEYYLKISVPIAAFIFSVIGAALGTYFRRSGLMVGLGLSIIIIFLYYVLLSIMKSYGISGRLNPLISAWGADIIFSGVAYYYILKASSFRNSR